MVSQIARRGGHGHAHRGRGAAAREQRSSRALQPALQRRLPRRQELRLRADHRPQVPADPLLPRRAAQGQPLLRPVPERLVGARDHRPPAEDLPPAHLRRHGVRAPLAPVPAAPDRALLGAVRGARSTPRTYRRDVDQAAQFLAGKETVVTEEITALMDAAAERLDYEEAARLPRPDPHAAARALGPGGGYARKGGDVDIVVAVEREGVWCVTLAMVRGGRHLGDRSVLPAERRRAATPTTVLEAFLEQHYAQQPDRRRASSPTSSTRRGREMEMLSAARRGNPVQIVSRPVGESRAWLDMARQNALARAQPARIAAQATQEARVRGAAGVPRIRGAGRAHRVLRHQPHHGRGADRLVRGVRQGRDAELASTGATT